MKLFRVEWLYRTFDDINAEFMAAELVWSTSRRVLERQLKRDLKETDQRDYVFTRARLVYDE